MPTTFLFKTRGGHSEGMGDVTSSLALAEEVRQKGYEASFVVNQNQAVQNLLNQHHFSYELEQDFYSSLTKRHVNIPVLVANQLNTPQKEADVLRSVATKMVTIDDTGYAAQKADLCFNVLYPIEGSIHDFSFIPLDEVYQRKHNIGPKSKPNVESILVTQGGSDTYGFTPKIVKALLAHDLGGATLHIVIGPNFQHQQELADVLWGKRENVMLHTGLTDLSDLILQADIAVTAGGNTLFELACLGVPSVVVCAEMFEVDTAARLEREGFGKNLGFGEHVCEHLIGEAVTRLMEDSSAREGMANCGWNLIDGQGAKRMANEMINRFLLDK